MKSPFTIFIKKLLIYTLIIGFLSLVLAFFLPDKIVSPAMPFLLLFFLIVNAVTMNIVLKTLAKKTSRFVNFFMISIFAKLMLYILIIVVYAIADVGDIVSFIITFFIYYLAFTVFELFAILKAQKENV